MALDGIYVKCANRVGGQVRHGIFGLYGIMLSGIKWQWLLFGL